VYCCTCLFIYLPACVLIYRVHYDINPSKFTTNWRSANALTTQRFTRSQLRTASRICIITTWFKYDRDWLLAYTQISPGHIWTTLYFLTQSGFLLFMLVRFEVLVVKGVIIYVLENVTPWPSNLRRGSAAACSLGMRFRIPLGHERLSVVSLMFIGPCIIVTVGE